MNRVAMSYQLKIRDILNKFQKDEIIITDPQDEYRSTKKPADTRKGRENVVRRSPCRKG